MSKEEEVKASVEETVRCYGTVDILVNNAGIVDVRMLHEYTSEDWDRVMGINVKSMFLSFKYAFPYLKEHDMSYVVNVGPFQALSDRTARRSILPPKALC